MSQSVGETLHETGGRSPQLKAALGDVATVARALLLRRIDDEQAHFQESLRYGNDRERLSRQLSHPELFERYYWTDQMAEYLVFHTSPGWYCHEGGDLVDDFFGAWKINCSDPSIIATLSTIAEKIVDQYDRKQCSFCSYEYEEDDDDLDNQGGNDD